MHDLLIQVGGKATGKTQFIKNQLRNKPPQRGLIIDPNNEYSDYEILPNVNFPEGVFRVTFNPQAKKLDMEKKYIKYIQGYTNGVVILENPMSIFETFPQDLFGLISIQRTRKLDVIMTMSTYKHALHPKLICNARYYVLYKSKEKIKDFQQRFSTSNEFDLFSDAESRLSDTKQSVIIDLITNRII